MRFLCITIAIICLHLSAKSQTIQVSGACITGTITFNYNGIERGRPWYYSEDGYQIFWNGSWLLSFSDGFDNKGFVNSCDTPTPPGTENSSCTWVEISETPCTGNSPLSITGDVTLPIVLHYFTVTEVNNAVVLNWQTSTEINNINFNIQRKIEGKDWATIGSVKGSGNSASLVSYKFTDSSALPSKNYYRLIQSDIDGKATYSNVVSIDVSTYSYYTIAGNPGNGIYKLNITTHKPVISLLSDINGKRLRTARLRAGLQSFDISNYPSGIYFLQIKVGEEMFTEKLIKR